MFYHCIFPSLLFISLCSAIVWNEPIQTEWHTALRDLTPVETAAPALLARNTEPNPTCGYISGVSGKKVLSVQGIAKLRNCQRPR
jgi:hypothetical protein